MIYPKCLPFHNNGGIRCDSWIGPCSCGAWHDGEDLLNGLKRYSALYPGDHQTKLFIVLCDIAKAIKED